MPGMFIDVTVDSKTAVAADRTMSLVPRLLIYPLRENLDDAASVFATGTHSTLEFTELASTSRVSSEELRLSQ